MAPCTGWARLPVLFGGRGVPLPGLMSGCIRGMPLLGVSLGKPEGTFRPAISNQLRTGTDQGNPTV